MHRLPIRPLGPQWGATVRRASLARSPTLKTLPLQGIILDSRVAFKASTSPNAVDEGSGAATEALLISSKVQKMVVKQLQQELQMRNLPYSALQEHELRAALQKKLNREEEVLSEAPQTSDQGQSAALLAAAKGPEGAKELLRSKYMDKLQKVKANTDKQKASAASAAAASAAGLMPRAEAKLEVDPTKYPFCVKSNGTPHVLTYAKSRFLQTVMILENGMEAEKVYGIEAGQMLLTRPEPAGVAELRVLLEEACSEMGLESHHVMVISDDASMLTAAARLHMTPCAYEPDPNKKFRKYFRHRIDHMFNVQHEIEELNGVSHIATFNGTSLLSSRAF